MSTPTPHPPSPPAASSPAQASAAPPAAAPSTTTTTTATAVLADDERLMREQLRARLTEVWPELVILGEAKNGIEAVQMVDQHRPDIVFLDIRMPGLNGVDAARQIAQLAPREQGDADELVPEIVFITAYDQYAVEAFEQGVADYVLKPAERERLSLTVQRIQKRLAAKKSALTGPHADGGDGANGDDGGEQEGAGAQPSGQPLQQLLHQLSARINPESAPRYLQWIQATVGQSIQMIPVEEVLFFISDEKYTRVQTAQVEALIRKPIKELVDEIDPRLFWQIHRSTLVAVKSIAGVTRDFRGRQIVSVKGHGEKLEVSRSYTGLFKGM
jgi:DNA-binding LytR/AlgR family response regulator